MKPRRHRAPNRAPGNDYLAQAERELYPSTSVRHLTRAQRCRCVALAKQRVVAEGRWPESKLGAIPGPSARKMRTYRARQRMLDVREVA